MSLPGGGSIMKRTASFVIILMSFAVVFSPQGVNSMDEIDIEDEENDVECSRWVREPATGCGGIDIISLVSEEDLTDVTVTLTVKETIELHDETSFSIYIEPFVVEIYWEDVEVYGGDHGQSENVDVNIDGADIIVTIPKRYLDREIFYLSAFAETFFCSEEDDWEEIESYNDEIPDTEGGSGTRAAIMETFDMALDDPEGDVERSYNERFEVSTHDHIDIVSLSAHETGSGDIRVELVVSGIISDEPGVSYSVSGNEFWICYCNCNGTINYDDNTQEESVSISGGTITAVLGGGKITDIDFLYAYTMVRGDGEDDETYTDEANNYEWDDDYIDVFDDMIMAIDISMPDVEEIVFLYSMEICDGETASLFREEMDPDEDGFITEEEMDELFAFEEEDLFGLEFLIDEVQGDSSFEVKEEGLVGPVDSDEPLKIIFETRIDFNLNTLKERHTVTLRTMEYEEWEDDDDYHYDDDDSTFPPDEWVDDDDYTYPSDEWEEEPESEGVGYSENDSGECVIEPITFTLSVPDGWRIDESSVEPVMYLDFIDEERTGVHIGPEDMGDLAEIEEGEDLVSFDIVRSEVDGDEEVIEVGDGGYESWWILVGIIASAVLLLLTAGKRSERV